MTLTDIYHSGFVLETEKSILIFDCWLDLNGVVPPFLKKDKPVYVFSSHFHEDHFNRAIFEWRKQHEHITYILSKDIYPRTYTSTEEPIRKMLMYGWPREAHGLTAICLYGH